MSKIPDSIREVLDDDEIENIENRNGWAFGTVVLSVNGEVEERLEDALIELYNGQGTAGRFGGVGVMATSPEGDREFKAYATKEAFEERGRDEGWYVEEYTDPTNPDYGQAAP